jgi:DNA (cytosine-5)-methyltransferase 1
MREHQRPSPTNDDRRQIRNPTNGFWANPEWLYCRDEKWRAVKPSLAPMVDGLPRGVVRGSDQGASNHPIQTKGTAEAGKMRLMGYGNAINIEVAVGFIKAYNEINQESQLKQV